MAWVGAGPTARVAAVAAARLISRDVVDLIVASRRLRLDELLVIVVVVVEDEVEQE